MSAQGFHTSGRTPTTNFDPRDDGGALALIPSKMTCPEFRDSCWGFAIYRCTKGNDAAWNKMLQTIRDEVAESLQFYQRQGLLQHHDLHVIDDKSLYGATSHEVRDHFLQWVPHELEPRLKPSESSNTPYGQWLRASETARYKYRLFVDDICLESLDHENSKWPVIKVLDKDWGPLSQAERQYEIDPDFYDGETEDQSEEVGWMYLTVKEYLNWYNILTEEDNWWPFYVRPPYIDLTETKDQLVGSWRNK